MNLFCNGEPREAAPSCTLQILLAEMGCARPGVAVAVNDVVIAAARWATTPLFEGDRVLVIQAAQGG